eukprot:c12601_g2_i1 orf=77-382(+)
MRWPTCHYARMANLPFYHQKWLVTPNTGMGNTLLAVNFYQCLVALHKYVYSGDGPNSPQQIHAHSHFHLSTNNIPVSSMLYLSFLKLQPHPLLLACQQLHI